MKTYQDPKILLLRFSATVMTVSTDAEWGDSEDNNWDDALNEANGQSEDA